MRPKTEDLDIDDDLEMNPASQKEKEASSIEFEIPTAPVVEISFRNKSALEILKEENEETSMKSSKQTVKASQESVKKNNDSLNKSNSDLTNGYESNENLLNSFFVNENTEVTDKIFEKQIDTIASANKKLIQSANKLFSTEQRVEADSKSIMNITQSLSIDDIKLMSKFMF
jgi:hypothetical protein